MMAPSRTEDEERLLKILESHGQQFLESFGPNTRAKGKKRKRVESHVALEESLSDEEEWAGIHWQEDTQDKRKVFSDSEDVTNRESAVDTVVFQDSTRGTTTKNASNVLMKTFMSSKVSKLSESIQGPPESSTKEQEENERTNAENDAILHRLIHTQLLSGSSNTGPEMTPAQRRKAMEGRILELAGKVKLGKGEKSIRAQERNRASKRVREGLADKVDERRKQELARAKELGNYHPMFKKLYEDESEKASKKRERGLKMGVGKFSGGMLKLSRHDIAKAQLSGIGRRK